MLLLAKTCNKIWRRSVDVPETQFVSQLAQEFPDTHMTQKNRSNNGKKLSDGNTVYHAFRLYLTRIRLLM